MEFVGFAAHYVTQVTVGAFNIIYDVTSVLPSICAIRHDTPTCT